MITLYQFEPVWDLPNASPFCMKLETYLRMTGLPYKIAPKADIRKAPKGKFPYIKDGENIVADSGLIIHYLKATYGDTLDADLDRQAHATALAFRRLFEEHLYWSLIYLRWGIKDNWKVTKQAYFGTLPPGLYQVIPDFVKKVVLRDLHGHGMGRHSPEEIIQFGKDDVTAVSSFLGDKAFFLDEEPRSVDATAYAFLANILWDPLDTPLKAHARKLGNLEPYCRRMKARFYP